MRSFHHAKRKLAEGCYLQWSNDAMRIYLVVRYPEDGTLQLLHNGRTITSDRWRGGFLHERYIKRRADGRAIGLNIDGRLYTEDIGEVIADIHPTMKSALEALAEHDKKSTLERS